MAVETEAMYLLSRIHEIAESHADTRGLYDDSEQMNVIHQDMLQIALVTGRFVKSASQEMKDI